MNLRAFTTVSCCGTSPLFASLTPFRRTTRIDVTGLDKIGFCNGVSTFIDTREVIMSDALGSLNASSFAWIQQVEYFTALPNFSVLVFDNRGSGNSTSPKGLYSTADMAADAVHLLNYVGWTSQRSLHLIGASLGGMIAMDLVCISIFHSA